MVAHARFEVARLAGRATRAVVRASGRGQGGSLPGRVALAADPEFITHASTSIDHPIIVTGTNGKTTTTAFVREFLKVLGPTVANEGANMSGGIAGSLLDVGRDPCYGVFEVDESYVARVGHALGASTVVVLNLSRDQLDRSAEVRVIADRIALAAKDADIGIANADDPMAVWAIRDFRLRITVAGTDTPWILDAGSCPNCGNEVVWNDRSWACRCGFARPRPDYWITPDNEVVCVDGSRTFLDAKIPGEFNTFNAAVAYATVRETLGVSLGAVSPGGLSLGGRFGVWKLTRVWGRPAIKTYLAKNPAGWHAIFDVLDDDRAKVVILGLNDRVADGRDTSWIWDVDFERLKGKEVIVTGERAEDMALRCETAGLLVVVEPDQSRAVRKATHLDKTISYLGNYTAFGDLMRQGKPLGALRLPGG